MAPPLKDLALHSNQFLHIPHHALKTIQTSLRTLDLGENAISEVHPNALAGLERLYGLRLAGNRIRKIGEDVFKEADGIRMLNLADNQIEHIDQNTFKPLKKLKVGTVFFLLIVIRHKTCEVYSSQLESIFFNTKKFVYRTIHSTK